MATSRTQFGQIVIDFLRAEGETRPLQVDERTFHLIAGDGSDLMSFAYLGHAHAEWEAAQGENGARVLRRRLWSMVRRLEVLAPAERLRGVLPRIRDVAWFSAVRRQAELELGDDPELLHEVLLPHKRLNEELAVHLAYELPTSVSELSGETLSAWKVSFDDLVSVALANLRERSLEGFEEAEPGVFLSPFRDSLDASRMLLVDDIAELPLKGAPVALAPTHDTLFITGADDAQGLQTIAAWAEEAVMEPRAHSAVAFRLEQREWRPWLPEVQHPAFAKLRLLQLQTLASAYARQKEVLESLLATRNQVLSIGSMRAFRSPGGAIFTSCAWQDGTISLLPQTDRIDFVRPGLDGSSQGAKVWSTSFELARQRLGAMMEPTGDVPPRWRVRSFPDEATLDSLAADGKI